MKLYQKNNVYIVETRHANGISEVRGFDRMEVLNGAIENVFKDRKDDGIEDFAPYEGN